MLNQVLTSLLHTRDSIADAAAALKLPLSEFIAIATSPQAQHILAQVEALEKRRAEVLQAAALAAALQTLHALTDADSLGDDDTRNIQRKSAVAILTHTRAAARLALDTKRAESLALHRGRQLSAKDRSPLRPAARTPTCPSAREREASRREKHRVRAACYRPTRQTPRVSRVPMHESSLAQRIVSHSVASPRSRSAAPPSPHQATYGTSHHTQAPYLCTKLLHCMARPPNMSSFAECCE